MGISIVNVQLTDLDYHTKHILHHIAHFQETIIVFDTTLNTIQAIIERFCLHGTNLITNHCTCQLYSESSLSIFPLVTNRGDTILKIGRLALVKARSMLSQRCPLMVFFFFGNIYFFFQAGAYLVGDIDLYVMIQNIICCVLYQLH